MPFIKYIFVVFLYGCTTIPVAAKLYCPPPLDLPKILMSELEPLEPKAYEKLTRRDRMLQGRVQTLCEIIETTQWTGKNSSTR